MRYLINPVKALLSLFAFILFLFLFVVSFQSHKIFFFYVILRNILKLTKVVCEIVFYGNPTMNFPGIRFRRLGSPI